MKKLTAAIQYECFTSFKYIWIFYAIQYAIVLAIYLMIGFFMGSFEDIGTNCLEINTIIYVGILGVLGFQEDFKMLLQSGFSRKYIFLATVSLFAFISGIMSLIDTLVGNGLHVWLGNYTSLFGGIYGYGNLFANWIWLFLFYALICSLLYLGILIIHKIGKTASIYLGIGLGGLILIITALFRYVLSAETVDAILSCFRKMMGFADSGALRYLFPCLTFLLLIAVLGAGSYAVIRRTELK